MNEDLYLSPKYVFVFHCSRFSSKALRPVPPPPPHIGMTFAELLNTYPSIVSFFAGTIIEPALAPLSSIYTKSVVGWLNVLLSYKGFDNALFAMLFKKSENISLPEP